MLAIGFKTTSSKISTNIAKVDLDVALSPTKVVTPTHVQSLQSQAFFYQRCAAIEIIQISVTGLHDANTMKARQNFGERTRYKILIVL